MPTRRHSVAKNGRFFKRNGVGKGYQVGFGDHHIFGETTIPIETEETASIDAQVLMTGETGLTLTTVHIHVDHCLLTHPALAHL
jgi:hypothetical protein